MMSIPLFMVIYTHIHLTEELKLEGADESWLKLVRSCNLIIFILFIPSFINCLLQIIPRGHRAEESFGTPYIHDRFLLGMLNHINSFEILQAFNLIKHLKDKRTLIRCLADLYKSLGTNNFKEILFYRKKLSKKLKTVWKGFETVEEERESIIELMEDIINPPSGPLRIDCGQSRAIHLRACAIIWLRYELPNRKNFVEIQFLQILLESLLINYFYIRSSVSLNREFPAQHQNFITKFSFSDDRLVNAIIEKNAVTYTSFLKNDATYLCTWGSTNSKILYGQAILLLCYLLLYSIFSINFWC